MVLALANSFLFISMLGSANLIDPLSILLVSEPLVSESIVATQAEYMNLGDSTTWFKGYQNQFYFVAEEHDVKVGAGFIEYHQQYGYDFGNEHYDLKTHTASPFLNLNFSQNSFWISPEEYELDIRKSVNDFSVGFSLDRQSMPISLAVDSYELELTETLDFNFTQRNCSVFLGWYGWQFSSFCSIKNDVFFHSGGSIGYYDPFFSMEVEYREYEINASDAWDDDENLSGNTEFNMAGKYWGFNTTILDWRLLYQYRVFEGGMLTDLRLQDNLITGIGKGRYIIYGQSDLHQQIARVTPPVWQSHWGHFSFPISFTYFDNLDIEAKLYESLLFLGLPLLSDIEKVNIQSALISSFEMQWKKEWKHWQLSAEVAQLVPISIKGDNSGNEEDTAGQTDDSPKEKTELFWPGFSLRVGLGLRF